MGPWTRFDTLKYRMWCCWFAYVRRPLQRIRHEFTRTDDWWYLKKWELIGAMSQKRWIPFFVKEFVTRHVR